MKGSTQGIVWIVAGTILCASGFCEPRQARAQETGLRWNPRHSRFGAGQYVVSLTLLGGVLARDQLVKAPQEPGVRGQVAFDASARRLLVADSQQGKHDARVASDVLQLSLLAFPLVVDSIFVAGAVHQNADVAYQMAMISAQSFLLTSLVTGLTKNLVGRQRPDASLCTEDTPNCSSSPNASFFSGHTSMAFTGAGLVCAHHQNLPLYGSGWGNDAACPIALAGASAVGVLRVAGDRHHATDVLAGAAVGLLSGYLLPNLLNYDFGAARDVGMLAPIGSDSLVGLSYLRVF